MQRCFDTIVEITEPPTSQRTSRTTCTGTHGFNVEPKIYAAPCCCRVGAIKHWNMERVWYFPRSPSPCLPRLQLPRLVRGNAYARLGISKDTQGQNQRGKGTGKEQCHLTSKVPSPEQICQWVDKEAEGRLSGRFPRWNPVITLDIHHTVGPPQSHNC